MTFANLTWRQQQAPVDPAVHWGANPGKLDLPAADSRGNSSEYLRAGSNISRRRTADYLQFAINTQGRFGLLLLCVFFLTFFYLICSNLFCIFVDSFCTTEKPQCFMSGGILTIAYMMRLSGVLLGTLLLIIVHASILQRSKTKSSSSVGAKEPVIRRLWCDVMSHDVMVSFHVRLCVVVLPETGIVAWAAWMRLDTLVCTCFQL